MDTRLLAELELQQCPLSRDPPQRPNVCQWSPHQYFGDHYHHNSYTMNTTIDLMVLNRLAIKISQEREPSGFSISHEKKRERVREKKNGKKEEIFPCHVNPLGTVSLF